MAHNLVDFSQVAYGAAALNEVFGGVGDINLNFMERSNGSRNILSGNGSFMNVDGVESVGHQGSLTTVFFGAAAIFVIIEVIDHDPFAKVGETGAVIFQNIGFGRVSAGPVNGFGSQTNRFFYNIVGEMNNTVLFIYDTADTSKGFLSVRIGDTDPDVSQDFQGGEVHGIKFIIGEHVYTEAVEFVDPGMYIFTHNQTSFLLIILIIITLMI